MENLSDFINVAEDDRVRSGKDGIFCPCRKCINGVLYVNAKEVKSHLIRDGFTRGYTCWDFHGEKEVLGSTFEYDLDDDVAQKEHAKFEKLFVAAEKALFGGCTKLTILSAMADDKDLHVCKVCKTSRYVQIKQKGPNGVVTKNGPPAKLLWYFPIIPRLERLYADAKEAKLLRWHAEERKKDGKMRHVADSLQWRNIDNSFEEFGGDIRNIRLGLSSDGFNPFGNMSTSHSTWPVLLCNYNLPPWLCMKRKYIMMSLLIQGPKQPGNDIDVYLKPLIDDLIKLWEPGVKVYDAYSKNYFTLRAMIFCTISDFPAYGNLSGYSTKGKKACPVCEDCTHSVWLRHCRKTIYMGHRRSLLRNHPYRKKKELFDGTIERGVLRPPLDGEATFSRVRDMNIVLGKGKDNPGPPKGIWKKKSIFWDLAYWEHLQVRHCLDVMHIEKNVCESLIGLLLNIAGKTKDGVNVRNDMEDMGIRPELAAKVIPGKRGTYLPPASYTMSKIEKTKFFQCLHGIKVPSGYSANIKKLVSMKDLKLSGMKSHDCHVLMTQMIPIAIREIKMCGPPSLRNMYPFERYMGYLKGYVRNQSRPEGSIVKGYAAEEVIEFGTNYLRDVRNVGIPQSRHKGRLGGVGTLGRKEEPMHPNDLHEAHFTVLQHMTSIAPYIYEHQSLLKNENSQRDNIWLAKKHNQTFSHWLKEKVRSTLPNVDKPVEELGFGPVRVVKYEGYDINGYTFYTRQQDQKSTVQNSGVTLIASTTENNTKDSYYGVIEEIWELDYNSFVIPLFKCKWVDNRRGLLIDRDGRDEYDKYDELPPFSTGIAPLDSVLDNTTYIRSDHNEGLLVDEALES
ncbi:uncharacterized protein Tco_0099705 [Tanacetum coccineum]